MCQAEELGEVPVTRCTMRRCPYLTMLSLGLNGSTSCPYAI
jgi:hypothetical protein